MNVNTKMNQSDTEKNRPIDQGFVDIFRSFESKTDHDDTLMNR